MPFPVLSIIQPFIDAGVVPPGCSRMLIDIPADDVVRVYYEIFGDQKVIDVMATLVQEGKLPVLVEPAPKRSERA